MIIAYYYSIRKAGMDTEQAHFWSSNFGRDYTDRNSRTPEQWDHFYLETWGHTKSEMNEAFLGALPRDIRILEVGCNTGMQLAGLQRMGFTHLYGVELQWYAVERAREFVHHVNILQGSGFDLPFRDGFFDLVCTNGVLIHIAPSDLPSIMGEMLRCSRRWIWGFEYYSEDLIAIDYRGHKDRLWKGDYAGIFMEQYPSLRLCRKELYPYTTGSDVDAMYLLERTAMEPESDERTTTPERSGE